MTRRQERRGTAAQWTAANPILAAAEWGVETDTGQAKLGDGVTHWNALAYAVAGSAAAIAVDTTSLGDAMAGVDPTVQAALEVVFTRLAELAGG